MENLKEEISSGGIMKELGHRDSVESQPDSVQSLRLQWERRQSQRLLELRQGLAEVFGNFFEFRHSSQVMQASYQIAKASGCSEDEALEVAESAFLHDLGKEYPRIKPYFINRGRWDSKLRYTRLTRQHSARGPYQLEVYHDDLDRYGIGKWPELSHYVMENHHVPPEELKGKKGFDQVVNMVSVADVFDVITCNLAERPHRTRQPLSALVAIADEIWNFGVKKKNQLDQTTARNFITRNLELEMRGDKIVGPAS